MFILNALDWSARFVWHVVLILLNGNAMNSSWKDTHHHHRRRCRFVRPATKCTFPAGFRFSTSDWCCIYFHAFPNETDICHQFGLCLPSFSTDWLYQINNKYVYVEFCTHCWAKVGEEEKKPSTNQELPLIDGLVEWLAFVGSPPFRLDGAHSFVVKWHFFKKNKTFPAQIPPQNQIKSYICRKQITGLGLHAPWLVSYVFVNLIFQ